MSIQKRKNPNAYSAKEEANRKAGLAASHGIKPITSIDEEIKIRKAAEEAEKAEFEEGDQDESP